MTRVINSYAYAKSCSLPKVITFDLKQKVFIITLTLNKSYSHDAFLLLPSGQIPVQSQ